MYYNVIQQFILTLGNLDAILAKATEQATTRGYSVDNFMTQRLAPDMLPFARQVPIACDAAKAAAEMLSGKPAPKLADDQKTVAELRERIENTLVYLRTIQPGDFAEVTDSTVIKMTYPMGKAMLAPDALMSRWVPNFYFHVSMTYAILRSGGIALGKMDYLGPIKLFDAQ